MKGKTLFKNFREVSAKEWKQNIQYDLKGKDYNDEVVWDSPEGIKVKPFYHADDLAGRDTEGSYSKPWKIGHTIYAGNAIMANEKAHVFFRKGAEAICFVIPAETVDPAVLLNNIDLKRVNIHLQMQFLSKKYLSSVLRTVAGSNNLFFQVDPIGHLARTGNWYESMSKDFSVLDELIALNSTNLLVVDMSLYENAGADIGQQLAFALAHANEYLNYSSTKGRLSKLKSIEFKMAIGGNYFFEIAKVRALRKLFEILTEAYGVTLGCHITAMPSKRNKTIFDYNVNMIRTTTECMSAILGGSDTIFNIPYDAVYKKDNDFANRIALNQLVLLKEESYFDKVENPTDGSYYIETLTSQLAEKALVLFKSIERDGGFLSQLKNQSIQNKIAESAKKQEEKFKTKKAVLIGTNAYRHSEDRMGDQLEIYPFVKRNPRKTLIIPIIEKRLAEESEQNRLKDE
jgi:methylmalonyl-CoA mutase